MNENEWNIEKDLEADTISVYHDECVLNLGLEDGMLTIEILDHERFPVDAISVRVSPGKG